MNLHAKISSKCHKFSLGRKSPPMNERISLHAKRLFICACFTMWFILFIMWENDKFLNMNERSSLHAKRLSFVLASPWVLWFILFIMWENDKFPNIKENIDSFLATFSSLPMNANPCLVYYKYSSTQWDFWLGSLSFYIQHSPCLINFSVCAWKFVEVWTWNILYQYIKGQTRFGMPIGVKRNLTLNEAT